MSLFTNDSADVCTAVKLTLSTPKVVIPVRLPPSAVIVASKTTPLPVDGLKTISPLELKVITPSAFKLRFASSPPSESIVRSEVEPAVAVFIEK